MILKSVKLECFKAAYQPEPIPLQSFNVLIGRNGSGKSTLLEALQWVDVALRRDAREACDRYFGMRDLVNLRCEGELPYFRLGFEWDQEEALSYELKVLNQRGLPRVSTEVLHSDSHDVTFVDTIDSGKRVVRTGRYASLFSGGYDEPDVLAMRHAMENHELGLGPLSAFWSRAVFLRLSPSRLADGSSAIRKSFEPILDEEGQTLPALLYELTSEQLEELAQQIEAILPGIRGVHMEQAELIRDTKIYYGLLEELPSKAGSAKHPIPAWMLSEGTRRITAILALLLREPAPTLLCIEEIENGLDPWTVIEILHHLQNAADKGMQVILTTHSPWLLDHVPMESILQVRRSDGDTRYERFCERPEIMAYHDLVPAGTRYVNEAE